MENMNSLSRREKEVVDLLLLGKSNKQIALGLGISERTVEFHLNKIYAKLQVGSRTELILKQVAATKGNSTKQVESTVAIDGESTDNGNQPARERAARSWRNTFSLIRKEVAMTIRISFEDLEEFLRQHPVLWGVLVFLVTSFTARYVVFALGLYVWISYALLGILLGMGSIYFGLQWKQLANGTRTFSPLIFLLVAAILPFMAAGFDQLYLNTVLRYTAPISFNLASISASAAWLLTPDGQAYRSTHLSVSSELLWLVVSGYMLILFFGSLALRKRPDQLSLA